MPTRERARAAITAGRVTVAGAPADKPARLVAPDEPLRLTGPPPRFVSRGGEKLDAALSGFGLEPAGRVALDAGASTGGFTDCLLQHGAAHVFALDVGHGQLHPRLRHDPRVTVLERTDLRRVGRHQLGEEPLSLLVADLSFISLGAVAAPLTDLAGPGADLVVLVKPQFEVGRAEASRGKGVVRQPQLWAAALERALSALEHHGARLAGLMPSPIAGTAGNVEFLAHLVAPPGASGRPVDRGALVADVVARAAAHRVGVTTGGGGGGAG